MESDTQDRVAQLVHDIRDYINELLRFKRPIDSVEVAQVLLDIYAGTYHAES